MGAEVSGSPVWISAPTWPRSHGAGQPGLQGKEGRGHGQWPRQADASEGYEHLPLGLKVTAGTALGTEATYACYACHACLACGTFTPHDLDTWPSGVCSTEAAGPAVGLPVPAGRPDEAAARAEPRCLHLQLSVAHYLPLRWL